jgi:hypothetical protein
MGGAPHPIRPIWGGNCLAPFEGGGGRGLEGEQFRQGLIMLRQLRLTVTELVCVGLN